jgi:hypothetical protein
MKFLIGLLIVSILLGCGASQFTSKTLASYKATHADGTTTDINYASDKEQVGLDASFESPSGVKAHIKVDKSGTAESVINAVAAQQKAFAELLTKLLPLVEKAALAGGS